MGELLRQCGLPLDASALVALRYIEADSTDSRVADTIRTKVWPYWGDLDDLAKEVIVLHALNTHGDAVWPALCAASAADKSAREGFHMALSLLCERHVLEEIDDEKFVTSSTLAYNRTLAPKVPA